MKDFSKNIIQQELEIKEASFFHNLTIESSILHIRTSGRIHFASCVIHNSRIEIHLFQKSSVLFLKNTFDTFNPIHFTFAKDVVDTSVVFKDNQFLSYNVAITFSKSGEEEIFYPNFAFTISHNYFNGITKDAIITNLPDYSNQQALIDFKDNYVEQGKSLEALKNGYQNSEYASKEPSKEQYRSSLEGSISPLLKSYHSCLYEVKNIPQYVSEENDPALQTGCELCALTSLINYCTNSSYNKNDFIEEMPTGHIGKESMWNTFIGNIENGFGCYAPVSKKTLSSIFKKISKSFDIIDKTNTPFYELLTSMTSPILVWCTMGNEESMYNRRYGSTKWKIEGNDLYWTGNEHCVVLCGYDDRYVYLADPEHGDEGLIKRDLFLFENRYNQMYQQAIALKIKEKE